MAIDIKDRALSVVNLSGLEAYTDKDGAHLVGGTCHCTLLAPDGNENGPGANVFIAVEFPLGGSIRDAERAVLARARDVLMRLASFSVDELQQKFERMRGEMPNFHEGKN